MNIGNWLQRIDEKLKFVPSGLCFAFAVLGAGFLFAIIFVAVPLWTLFKVFPHSPLPVEWGLAAFYGIVWLVIHPKQ